ncbi:DEAD/DEAH box helicase [uncultured Thiodictyon sp.]|uniref:Lhr family helicase n=1 Tax=uncultured Thiodictyon sp. TaxID=1846217 RepID=UPI0025CCAF4E|nr:DEAD/DEAH box helicase [uncultured Thiodictyon sp.]
MDYFAPATRRWFDQHFAGPTPAQARGWPVIAAGCHALITAPTGSGKTLAAFLWAIDRLMAAGDDAAPRPPGVQVLYISPLKALVYDIERNLRAPLAGVARVAADLGLTLAPPRVDIRTGDTPPQERARQLREPAEILVTTPESFYLLLGSRAAENLRTVHTVIVDEVHALAPTKRGAHLALSLERLAARCPRDPQRIGLSATVRPLADAARFLGGERVVEIVDAADPPRLDLKVCVPVPDMERPPLLASDPPDSRQVAPERGIWSALYPALLDAIRTHRSTIIFVNSRGLAERLCRRLNDLAAAGDEAVGAGLKPVRAGLKPAPTLVRAHHGSVSFEQRTEIEEALKRGELKAIVATSSLEMGIDMGAVDQVLLVESPGSVARGLQRVGRAGHGVGEVSSGRIFPKFRGDLLECAVVAARMLTGELEPFRMPRNALDVLAQQVAAHCATGDRTVGELHALVTRAGPYRELSRTALEAVLEMLSGGYPGGELADLKPLLAWDRATDTLSARRGTALIARLNAGTIPDRGYYSVHLGADGPRIGELDEEMVFESKAGDCILLGATSWQVEQITRDRVIVSPAPGEPGRLPFWHGDGPGRPLALGRAVGAFCRQAAGLKGEAAADWVQGQAPLDDLAAVNLAAYIRAQREATGQVPSDRTIVVERFRDELGDWRVCILSPYGAPIHAPWAMALQARLGRRSGVAVQVMYTDDGIVLRLADGEDLPTLDDLLPDPTDVEDQVTEQLADTALFAGLFRENAARALLTPRRQAKGRQPLWAQRLRAQTLLATVRRYPSFPLVIETYRQALGDVFDLPGLKEVLTLVQSRAIRVHQVETAHASPFARSLVFAYVAAYLYEQDAPLPERRAQALTLDRGLLAELLGQTELRELIDPAVLADLEAELQHRTDGRRARDADELHDLLRRLGDLTAAEIAERCVLGSAVASAWLATLKVQGRAAPITINGESRWIATEDAGLYRDALGLVLAPDLPESCLTPRAAPLEHLIRRYAHTHGPFLTREPAARLGLRPAQIEPVLRLLESQGTLVRGELRPTGTEPEWCDGEVLQRLRRRTLARARDAVAPVDGATLGRFLPAWQGIGEDLKGPDRLLEVVQQLAGLSLPWSQLDRVLLPARVPGYRSQDLDLLAAAGQIVWIGRGALGPKDGKVALYPPAGGEWRGASGGVGEPPAVALHQVLIEHLRERGACFLMELTTAPERAGIKVERVTFESAVWDLVWAGLITNDTFAPLRSLAGPIRTRHRGREPALAGGRWSLVADLSGRGVPPPSDTQRLLAQARLLLDRYGVVSREAVQAEGVPGGFAPLYRVLKQMEESGRVRRGWFVEGLSGAQFALPGALERLRAARLDELPIDGFTADTVCVLSALDPANPYGALLPWPATAGPAPRRVSGAWVILVAGKPVLYLGSSARALSSFPSSLTADGGELPLALAALARLSGGGRRRLLIQTIDGQSALQSPLREALLAAGFAPDYDALVPGRCA